MAEQSTAAIWAERVRAWRGSGQTAAEFSAGRGFAAGTLKMWASRLPSAESAPSETAARGRSSAVSSRSPMLARVVRSEVRAMPASVTGSGVPVEVFVGDVRVRVEGGADEAALRVVFRALGVAR